MQKVRKEIWPCLRNFDEKMAKDVRKNTKSRQSGESRSGVIETELQNQIDSDVSRMLGVYPFKHR